MELNQTAAWMALAFRSTLQSADILKIALGPGPDPHSFPAETIRREQMDAMALDELGVEVLPISEPGYPVRLQYWLFAPVVLFVAGRRGLLEEEGVTCLAYRTKAAQELSELIEAGSRVAVVLSKGMLKATTMLRGLQEPIADGQVALVSAEPPRAAWGPSRDLRRDALAQRLSRLKP